MLNTVAHHTMYSLELNPEFLGQISRFLGNAPRSAVLHLPGASEVGRADTYCDDIDADQAPRRGTVPPPRGPRRLQAPRRAPDPAPTAITSSLFFLSSSNYFFLGSNPY